MAKTLLEVLAENEIEYIESSNGRYAAHCPFHEGDREPSFTIYPNETYYCFGCHVWGNPVKFLVDYKGWTSKEAMEWVGVDFEFPRSEKRVIKIKNLTKTCKFLYGVANDYHDYLLATPGPKQYLFDRGLTERTILQYRLGYTDGAVLDFQFAEDYEMANEIGLLNKGGYEAMSHRITIPNIVDDKYCDFMIGRTVINDKIKYLGTRMPKPICGFYDSRNSPILFLVEGNFDYLILRQWGYPAVVMSGSHLSKVNYILLRDKVVVIVPDNDEVGLKAANEIHSKLPQSTILDYKSLGVKDIGELAVQDNAKERFMAVVEEELWDILSLNLTLAKYLPISISGTPLPLISKPQDLIR